MLKALIFDFDGIIVDSEPMHFRAFLQVLEPMGINFTWEEYCETYIGYDDRDAFRAAFDTHGKKIHSKEIRRLIAEKAAVFQQFVRNGEATPLPGAVELIQSLPRVLPLALCSGALREDILPIIGNLGIGDAFDVIVTAEDTPVSKPDPAPYSEAWKLLAEKFRGLENPNEGVAVEDTPSGILSAKGAGLKVLAVTNSYDRDFLLEADAITDSLSNVDLSTLHDLVL
ncbi:MAG: HAD family phosphatase [Kiritimatiellales bacterium]|nr:HAD family phosphatase [Kiritimatiellales bacterium]